MAASVDRRTRTQVICIVIAALWFVVSAMWLVAGDRSAAAGAFACSSVFIATSLILGELP